jgi:hypothetical protein
MRILVVAQRSVATPALLEEIKRRAEDGPCEFSLLIPCAGAGGGWTLRHARRLFERATGHPVEGLLSEGRDEFQAVERTLQAQHFDEVIISTLPEAASRWLRDGLPSRVGDLGTRVTVVTPEEAQSNSSARVVNP